MHRRASVAHAEFEQVGRISCVNIFEMSETEICMTYRHPPMQFWSF